jgi:hypothetical protein
MVEVLVLAVVVLTDVVIPLVAITVKLLRVVMTLDGAAAARVRAC